MANETYNPSPIPAPIRCVAKTANGTPLPTCSTNDIVVGTLNQVFPTGDNLTKCISEIKASIINLPSNVNIPILLYLSGSASIDTLISNSLGQDFVDAVLERVNQHGNFTIAINYDDGNNDNKQVNSKFVRVSSTLIEFIFAVGGINNGDYVETTYQVLVDIYEGEYQHTEVYTY